MSPAKAPRGQNFLHPPNWQRRVAAAVEPQPGDALLEIGGGPGDITALLASQVRRLFVVEINPALALALRRRFAPQPHVEVLQADILDLDLAALAAAADAPLRAFGNLPYYITSPILLRLFRSAACLRDATVMMQREVADRLLTPPGGSAFGLLSATAQLYVRPRRLFDIPPGAFRPPPQVHSSLLRLDFDPQADRLGVAPLPFEAFLKLAFARKRKLLSNNLRDAYSHASIQAALAAAGLPPDARAEQLALPLLAALFRRLAS